jgi:hypothetical protein
MSLSGLLHLLPIFHRISLPHSYLEADFNMLLKSTVSYSSYSALVKE